MTAVQGRRTEGIPRKVEPRYQAIVALIEEVCREHLNDEYAQMGRKLAARLARKRPSPLLRGRAEIWACGIVYALGSVNFLFDKSSDLYMSVDELCRAFGVNKNSGAKKAARIKEMFKMYQMDPKWTLPSLMDENPWVWLMDINGLLVDIRTMPRRVQEIAYEKGLIPYIPADREE